MRSILMVCLLFLASCSGCAHFTKPTCKQLAEDFITERKDWVPIPPMLGETFAIVAMVNPAKAEVEGRVFILPEDPDYRKEGLEKELPNGSDHGYCTDGETHLRVMGFTEKMDPNAGLTET